MIQIIFTFLAAFLLSGIAAYYSVIGLTSIFTGAFWSVVIMGSSLEFAKLVTASWLYRNWKVAHFTLKTYLTVAVLLLMLITSMGIFGFLSKSHIDSTLDAGQNSVELKVLDEQEKGIRNRLDYLLARAKDPSTASNKLDRQIQSTQKELAEVSKKKLPLLRDNTKLTAEIGPIKYVADMLYGQDENGIDKAVRLVIMLIMLVFDPLAVLLLIAGNISLEQRNESKRNRTVENSTIRGSLPPETPQGKVDKNDVQSVEQPEQDQVEKLEQSTSIEVNKDNIAEGPMIEHEEVHHDEGLYSTTIKG